MRISTGPDHKIRHKRIIAILLLSGIGLSGLHSQNLLKVKQLDGTEISFALTDVHSLLFPDGKLMITRTKGASELFSLELIQVMHFGEAEQAVNTSVFQQNRSPLLYPNPVEDLLTIQIQSNFAGRTQVVLTDMQGKVVYKNTISPDRPGYQLELNVERLQKGMYICRITDGLTIETGKFIKL